MNESQAVHAVLGHLITPPYPSGYESAVFALGCFWGAERLFWQLDGVWTTAVGYTGGHQQNPSYELVCSGETGHAEAVLVVYDPATITFDMLLNTFWENHDPTQGNRQGNDVGSQYRSGIYTYGDLQYRQAVLSKTRYQQAIHGSDYGEITTEIKAAPKFYYAEQYHQQYLHKNPAGYCGLKGTGVSCA